MNDFIYFFDSYALIEILKGNQNYAPFLNCFVITTKINLFEVYYHFLREQNDTQAREFLTAYYPVAIDFDQETIAEAALFKRENKKKNLSLVDCIGYVLAKRYGIRFLTGDKEFEDVDKVEFVK
jgi:predicted nucleic acid-binding protein